MIEQLSDPATASYTALTQHRKFSFPYIPIPEALYYWGPVTASINWCEEDYVVTKYIAEFCNTTTNAGFIILAAFAIRNSIKYGYETRIFLTSMGFMLVGIGSWLFHMTLKYDELPMIYTTLIMFWGVFDYGLSQLLSALLAVFTVLLGGGITWYYLVNKNPVFHEVAYGLITASVLFQSWYLAYSHVKDPFSLGQMKRIAISGAVLFLSGFGLWGIDRGQCSNLTTVKHWMGIPWGFIFELHGWWHILTGLGVALFITVLNQLRVHLAHQENEYEMQFTLGFWPTLVRKGEGYKLVDDHEA